jgi:hypothetical protein
MYAVTRYFSKDLRRFITSGAAMPRGVVRFFATGATKEEESKV